MYVVNYKAPDTHTCNVSLIGSLTPVRWIYSLATLMNLVDDMLHAPFTYTDNLLCDRESGSAAYEFDLLAAYYCDLVGQQISLYFL